MEILNCMENFQHRHVFHVANRRKVDVGDT